jgi:hypothetical protein
VENQNQSELEIENDLIVKAGEVCIYESDIDFYIQQGCQKYDIEDLKAVGQKPFKAVCGFVGRNYFKNGKILKDKNLYDGNKSIMSSNYNKYNYDAVYVLSEYFNSICDRYNKLMSLEALSLFLGMNRETIKEWGKNEPTTKSFMIYKKAKDTRLEGILDDAYDNGNVTGTMFVGNVEYGLNLPGVTREQSTRRVLTSAELPKLSDKPLQLSDENVDNST